MHERTVSGVEMANFFNGARTDAPMSGVTVLVCDYYASQVRRSTPGGPAGRALGVEVLMLDGANPGLPEQSEPALNVADGRALAVNYPDEICDEIGLAGVRGPRHAVSRIEHEGQAVGAAYVVRADVVAVPSPQGPYLRGATPYQLVLDPRTIEPAAPDLFLPENPVTVQRQAIAAAEALAELGSATEHRAPGMAHGVGVPELG